MMRARAVVVVAGMAMCLGLSGCARKAPNTAPQASSASMDFVVPQDLPATAPSETPSSAAPDPLDGDLASINRYVVEQGLLRPAYFDYDRSGLREDARSALQGNAAFMKAHPQFVVTIEGHCDERGTVEYNLALGQLRVSSAQEYLGNLGVSGQQMQTVSYGREKPFCTEANESCWGQNRRAHFVITDRR